MSESRGTAAIAIAFVSMNLIAPVVADDASQPSRSPSTTKARTIAAPKPKLDLTAPEITKLYSREQIEQMMRAGSENEVVVEGRRDPLPERPRPLWKSAVSWFLPRNDAPRPDASDPHQHIPRPPPLAGEVRAYDR